MSIRQQIIKHLNQRLNKIIPNTPVVQAYEKAIMAMSDEELELWIQALENGVQDIPDPNRPSDLIRIVSPNLDKKNQLSTARNFALADEMGHSFFKRLWLTNPVTGQVTLTNRKYLVLDIMIRRQAQTLDEKISLPADDRHIDELTGQVTGASKGSSITYPEVQMLAAQGLHDTLLEFLKARGGDEEAWAMMKRSLIETGQFNLEELNNLQSRAKVNQSLSHYLTGMHIRNNV